MCSTRPRLTRSGSQSMEPATLRVLSHMIALPRLEHISAKAIIVCHSEPGAQASCLPLLSLGRSRLPVLCEVNDVHSTSRVAPQHHARHPPRRCCSTAALVRLSSLVRLMLQNPL